MKFGMREKWRWLRTRTFSPFQRIGHKLKLSVQRFIIKTVDKHTNVNASIGDPSGPLSSGLLLSLLSARRRSESVQPPPFQSIAVQDYLLTVHPHADFFYHRPTDLAVTPWILRGNYEQNVSAWICSNVSREDRVLMLGVGEGYHALSVAKQIESAGQLFVLAFPTEDQTVFELNFRSNRLVGSTELSIVVREDSRSLAEILGATAQQFRPSKILIELPTHLALDQSILHAFGIAEVFVIEDGEVTNRVFGDCSDQSSLPRKVA